ncbi:hypothetical protein CA850_27650 [Micromonospora echinospora]|uniref:Uncharacterized protein n=1 Tax=Micromonospora echinospora TaxID=1877 RepID=A0A1C4VWV0_MICEC|nr:hypothetical protein [Micromonospora echinospora]OZV76257.1 hypothetical protein CA850_27650 [Micromonospora echinospora]SCE88484.1 hypothetical protein GA0070618_1654 [Micromonospora echinospora]
MPSGGAPVHHHLPPNAIVATPAAGNDIGADGRPGTSARSGTVYGGSVTEGPGFATVALPTGNPVENTGSLTGHILAQGWADTPTERSRNTRVIIVLVASLGLLVAISVVVALIANDALGGLMENLLNG